MAHCCRHAGTSMVFLKDERGGNRGREGGGGKMGGAGGAGWKEEIHPN